MKPGDQVYDDQVKGLICRANQSGISFLLVYRSNGRQRKPKIGNWPTITLDQARRIAKEMLLQLASGKDPMEERNQSRSMLTVDQVWPRYLSEHATTKKTGREDERIYSHHIPAWFKRLPVPEVGYSEVIRVRDSMKSVPYQSNRAVALISKFLELSETWGIRPLGSNPCRKVSRFREVPRRRYMTREELANIAEALRKREKQEPYSVAFIRLLMLTGARCGELANARWKDLDGNRIILFSHKTDQDGHPRVIQLPTPAVEIIAALPERLPDDTILSIKSPKRLWDSVRKEAGCSDLRLHDLRHSFASIAVGSGFTLHQIGELLGHRDASTTKRYAHLMNDAAALVAETVADSIANHFNGKGEGEGS